MSFRANIVASSAVIGAVLATPAAALEKVAFGTNWLAQAEHGGFYQSVADGTYEGRFFVSTVSRPIYSPITPSAIRLNAPRNSTTTIREA